MNILSIDLESWCYPNIEKYNNISSSERMKLDNGYLERSIYFILNELKKRNIKCTFFVLAETSTWPGINFKDLIKEGHEIGFHTYNHKIITNHKLLEDQIYMSNYFLNEFKPKGYRSPQFIYNKEYDKLLELNNFKYTSNKFQNKISRKNFLNNDKIFEFPISAESFQGNNKIYDAIDLNIKNILKFKFIGSAYFFPIISNNYLIQNIDKINYQGFSYHLFLHNWQIIKSNKNFDKKILLKNPFYFPYTLDIKKKFLNIISNIHFTSIENFLR